MSRFISLLLRFLSHNDNHFFEVTVQGQQYQVCTRCTGMSLGFLASLPFVVGLGFYRAPGSIVAGLSVALFLPDFIYWALTRVRKLRDRNLIRGINGALLGVGIAAYGQADIFWGLKLAIPALLLLIVFVGNPLIGRSQAFRSSEGG
jgi:uncharacterized membrane protein